MTGWQELTRKGRRWNRAIKDTMPMFRTIKDTMPMLTEAKTGGSSKKNYILSSRDLQ